MKKAAPITSNRLPQKLKAIRVSLKLSQNELLERIGFADHLFRSNISQYERGHRVPTPAVLLAYARLANLDLAVLIDDDLDPPNVSSRSIKSEGFHRRSKSRKTRKGPAVVG
jgi:transcriptional regulator with XRE-family HTH domain